MSFPRTRRGNCGIAIIILLLFLILLALIL
jgi:hypothetical protein